MANIETDKTPSKNLQVFWCVLLTFDHKSVNNQRIKTFLSVVRMQNLKPYKGVEITFRQDYLHITHPDNFVVLPADLDNLWMNIANACKIYNCNRVLSEGRVDFSKLRAFDTYNAGFHAGEIRGLRMACLFYDHSPDEKTEFFKTVASNRGSKIEYFTNRAEALKWLGVDENE